MTISMKFCIQFHLTVNGSVKIFVPVETLELARQQIKADTIHGLRMLSVHGKDENDQAREIMVRVDQLAGVEITQMPNPRESNSLAGFRSQR